MLRMQLRLVQQIYLVGLGQFVIVVTALVVLAHQRQPPLFLDDTVRYVADGLSAQSARGASLQPELDRAAATLHWSLAVYDDGGNILATSGVRPAPALAGPDPRYPALRRPFGGIGSAPVQIGGRSGTLVFELTPRPGPSPGGLGGTVLLVLVVVGISSWFAARSLAVPLARLVAATNAFGEGNLTARTRLRRSDELGDLAKAFDTMAERITKAIRAERELLANISHELRTPLQRIRIAVDLAAEGDASTARDALADIGQDLGELERIVDDVLAVTRFSLSADVGPVSVPPLRLEPVDLGALLDRSVARFRSAHPDRSLETAVFPACTLRADPVLLRRVVDNLLENADKYTEEGTHAIALTCRQSPGEVVVEVRDDGIGIAPADLERVFEPFFRADRSRTRATGGLGLGLALARRIVEAHGGTLSLESEPGRGTTARVTLPFVE